MGPQMPGLARPLVADWHPVAWRGEDSWFPPRGGSVQQIHFRKCGFQTEALVRGSPSPLDKLIKTHTHTLRLLGRGRGDEP